MTDLDAYISRYGGYTKLRRLDWIAQRCPALAPDCYRAALTLLRQGINTQSYRDISTRAVVLMGPEHAVDTEWAEQVCVYFSSRGGGGAGESTDFSSPRDPPTGETRRRSHIGAQRSVLERF